MLDHGLPSSRIRHIHRNWLHNERIGARCLVLALRGRRRSSVRGPSISLYTGKRTLLADRCSTQRRYAVGSLVSSGMVDLTWPTGVLYCRRQSHQSRKTKRLSGRSKLTRSGNIGNVDFRGNCMGRSNLRKTCMGS